MSYCLNPRCQRPENPKTSNYCQHCGWKLRLGDRFRALKLIGRGGFGKTLLAVDEQADEQSPQMASAGPGELCVIKLMLPRPLETDSQKAAALFRQEAERLANLGQHPQIPRLLAHYEQPDAQYLVQDFIDGENLEQVLTQEGPFSEAQLRDLLTDLLPVLHFVHDRQIIHRDIKPANIIRPRSGAHYALVDFGAAKLACSTGRTGTLIGSAGFVAPEQAMGKAEFASDLYSLGVTAIYLLTGMHPFDLYSVSEDAWTWRQYLPRPVTSQLRRVLDKLLQKATSQRYRSAAVVLEDLQPPRLHTTRSQTAAAAPVNPRRSQRAAPRLQPPAWRCAQTLTGHDGEVTAIALSPRSQLLASGSSDRSIKLWRLATGELLHTFPGRSLWFGPGHSARITALLFSRDGKLLISGSEDGTIKQWDLTTLELITTLVEPGWGVSALALSRDERLLVSGDRDGAIHYWQTETDELLLTLAHHPEPVSALLVAADGQTLISGSYDKSICLWDWGDEQPLKALNGHLDRVSALALSPDGDLLLSGSWDQTLKCWDLLTGEQLRVWAAHQDRITALAVHPDDQTFASASEDGTIKLWDLQTGDRLQTLRHAWGVNVIGFTANGRWLVSGSADETLKIWQRD